VLDATYHSFLLYSSCPLLDKKMKSFLAIALCLAASAFAQTPLMVNTPEVVVSCQPVNLTFTGTGPFTLSVFFFPIDGQAAIIVFNKTNANSVVWLVNVPANSKLVLILLDGNGNTAESAGFTVGDGSSTCTGTSFSFGSTTATPASVTPATSPTASSLGSSNKQFGASSSTSTASTTATPKSGASRVTGQFAAAGIMGAAMVALLG